MPSSVRSSSSVSSRIGAAPRLLLSETDLSAYGRLVAVDYQCFEPENRGTYSIGRAAEMKAKPPQVDLAAAALPGFDVVRLPDNVQELTEATDADAYRGRRLSSPRSTAPPLGAAPSTCGPTD